MIKVTNTLTKQKEELIPRKDKSIKMFVCGPTVYDYIHIGNARTFVLFDVVAKYLRYKGFDLDYIQNITDIDDKIIKKSSEENKLWKEISEFYFQEFKKDAEALSINSPKYVKATDHIEEVKKQVKILKSKGHVYLIEDDGWYFDLSTFPDYGKLSGRKAEMADDGVSRIDESDKKKNKGDFCVWKLARPGESWWDDEELGNGRPGWHIEDTAITEHYFGPQYDLHGAGQDLIFPHHEAEITQQESASGLKPFVRYWMHVAFLVNKETKMSKSLGNFETARNLLNKYSPETLRFYFLSAHYRTPLDYSEKLINQSAAAVQRIKEFNNKLTLSGGEEDLNSEIEAAENKFMESMDDDFNTAGAFGAIFELISKVNPLLISNKLSGASAKKISEFLEKSDQVLNIIPKKEEEVPEEVARLVEQREKYRQDKNYEESDKIRAQIKDLGWQIEDTIYGPLLVRIS